MIIKLTAKDHCVIRPDSSPDVPVNEFVEIPPEHYGEFYIRLCHGKEGILVPSSPFPANWSGVPKITIVNNSANELNLRAGDEIGELHIRYNPPSPIAGTHLELGATFATRVVKEDGLQVMTDCGRVYEVEYIAKRIGENDLERVDIPRTTEWNDMGDGLFLPRFIMVGYKFHRWTDAVEVQAVRPDLQHAALRRELLLNAELKEKAEESEIKSPISIAVKLECDPNPGDLLVSSFVLNDKHTAEIEGGRVKIFENGRYILTAEKYTIKFDGKTGFVYDILENGLPGWIGKDYTIEIIQPKFSAEYSLIRAFLQAPSKLYGIQITPHGEITEWHRYDDTTEKVGFHFGPNGFCLKENFFIPALRLTVNKIDIDEMSRINILNRFTCSQLITALVKRLYTSVDREYPEYEIYHGHLFVKGELAYPDWFSITPVVGVEWKGTLEESLVTVLLDADTGETYTHSNDRSNVPSNIRYYSFSDSSGTPVLLDRKFLMDLTYACFLAIDNHGPKDLNELKLLCEKRWLLIPDEPKTVKSHDDRINLTTHVVNLIEDPDTENGVGLVFGDDINDQYHIRSVHRVVPWKSPEQLIEYFENFDIAMTDHHVIYFTGKLMKVAPDRVERIRKIFTDSKRIFAEVTEPTYFKDLKFKNTEVKNT